MQRIKKIIDDYTLNHLLAGIITILVGYTASIALIFQAAQVAGANLEQTTSWIFAVCLSMGLTSFIFSLYWKIPVVTAWSTPGVVLLISSLEGVTLPQVIGAFVVMSVLTIILGVFGLFEKMIKYTPMELSSALLAGVLMQLTINVFGYMKSQPILVGVMFLVYWLFKYFNSKYIMVMVVLSGIIASYFLGKLQLDNFALHFVNPVFIFPEFNLKVIMSIAIPLFLVTMTGQNIPGYTIAKSHGYNLPASKIMMGVGFSQLVLSCYGCFSTNIGALTASISMTDEVDRDPSKRYLATVTSGVLSIIIALFAGSIAYFLHLFPNELIMSIAGIALISTTAQSLRTAFSKTENLEIIFITFCIAASGVNFFGMSSAFWSFLVGTLLFNLFSRRKQSPQKSLT